MDNVATNERGEKVLGPSRRPDGTLRKERRIRAGYTPQDELPAYVSPGQQVRRAPLAAQAGVRRFRPSRCPS